MRFMYRVLNNEALERERERERERESVCVCVCVCVCNYITCTHVLPHAIPTLGTISLVYLGQA